MSETTAIPEVRRLLYRAVRELEYVQIQGCAICATSEGEAIVREGMALLGIKSLSEEALSG